MARRLPPAPPPLATLLTRAAIERLADERSLERGIAYFEDGHVTSLELRDGRVVAEVVGTQPYRVELWVQRGALHSSCDCPVGDELEFCKHLVATSLAWLAAEAVPATHGSRTSRTRRGLKDELAEARTVLLGQSKEALVERLIRRAVVDDGAMQELRLEVARNGGPAPDLDGYRAAMERACAGGRFVDYRAVPAYARGIETVVDSLEQLLAEGHAAAVIGLVEDAFAPLERALESADDSDGRIGEELRRLEKLHLDACVAARPDPERLAARLFALEMKSGFDVCHGAAVTYAKVLGKRGIDKYRELARPRFELVAPAKPGDDPGRFAKHFRIRSCMEAVARASGDFEELVAVLQRDLDSSYGFLRLAEACAQHGDDARAIRFAQQGLAAFAGRADPRLRQFLAKLHQQRGRHEMAVKLAWTNFIDQPDEESCADLEEHAVAAGDWPTWRTRMLAELRRNARSRHDGSLLVAALMRCDVERALEAARNLGCDPQTWCALAAGVEQERPDAAIAIWKEELARRLVPADRRSYESAIALLRTLRKAMVRAGRQEEFERELAALRIARRARRSFIAMLDKTRW